MEVSGAAPSSPASPRCEPQDDHAAALPENSRDDLPEKSAQGDPDRGLALLLRNAIAPAPSAVRRRLRRAVAEEGPLVAFLRAVTARATARQRAARLGAR